MIFQSYLQNEVYFLPSGEDGEIIKKIVSNELPRFRPADEVAKKRFKYPDVSRQDGVYARLLHE